MSKHYMSKGADGEVIAVNANEWGRYRADGYVFRNKNDWDAQRAGGVVATAVVADVVVGDAPPTMENTKAEIVAWLKANDYEVDTNDTKAELLDAIV